MTSTAIQWEAVQDAILDWAREVTGLVWMWGDQDAYQPPYPYGTITRIAGPTKIGGQDEVLILHRDGAPTQQVHIGPREFTMQFQVRVGSPEADTVADAQAESYLATLQGSTRLGVAIDLFRPAKVAVIEELAIAPFPGPVGTESVSMASMDIRFATESRVYEDIDTIESVSMGCSIDDHPLFTETAEIGPL